MLVQGDLSRDVSKTAQRIITKAVAIWGRLDVLVNNASQYYSTHLGAVTEEHWANLIQANLMSPFFLSQVYKEQGRCSGLQNKIEAYSLQDAVAVV